MDSLKILLFFILWTCLVFHGGFVAGKKSVQNRELKKDVQLYQKREEATCKQEKTAKEIIYKWGKFRSDVEECNFVLDFDISKCLR